MGWRSQVGDGEERLLRGGDRQPQVGSGVPVRNWIYVELVDLALVPV
jgi:hypothetical protein